MRSAPESVSRWTEGRSWVVILIVGLLLGSFAVTLLGSFNARATKPNVTGVNVNPDPVPLGTSFQVGGAAEDAADFFAICDVSSAEWYVFENGDPGYNMSLAMNVNPQGSCTYLLGWTGTTTDAGIMSVGIYTACVRAGGVNETGVNWEWSNDDCATQFTVETAVPDFAPPLCSDIQVAPNPAGPDPGNLTVNITANYDDTTTGNHNIALAEYRIAPPDNAPVVGNMGNGTWRQDWDTVNPPIWNVSAQASSTKYLDVSGFLSGDYDIYVHAEDDQGNWGWNDTPAWGDPNLTPPYPEVCFVTLTVNNIVSNTGPRIDFVAFAVDPVLQGTPTDNLTAIANDTGSGSQNVIAMEYHFPMSPPCDATKCPPGTGIPMNATDGAFDEVIEEGYSDVGISSLAPGLWCYYVIAMDSLNNWSSTYAEYCLTVSDDIAGPDTTSCSVTPSTVTEGYAFPVWVNGTADDTANGAHFIMAAEYFFDFAGADGTGTAMDPVDTAWDEVVEDVTQLFNAVAVPAGSYTFYVHAQDDRGNWGPHCTVPFTVNPKGSEVLGLNFAVNPVAAGTATDLLQGWADDASAGGDNISAGEYFVGAPGMDGTGIPMNATDGFFNSSNESIESDVMIGGWAPGSYDFFVHAQDENGIWGPFSMVTLVIIGLEPPQNFWVRRQGGNLILEWDPSAGGAETEYNIYHAQNDVNGFNFASVHQTVVRATVCTGVSTPFCSWTDSVLTGEGNDASAHYYILRASDGSNEDTNTLKAGKRSQTLVRGYNDISVPWELQDSSTPVVFQSITGSYDSIGAFLYANCGAGTQGQWTFYNTSLPQDLATVDNTMGLRVRITAVTATLITTGRVPTSTSVTLCGSNAGKWNFVGYPKFTDGALPDVLDSWGIAGNYDLVAYRDATDKRDPWKIFDPNNPAASDLTTLLTGMGIWILMTQNDTWTPPGDGSP